MEDGVIVWMMIQVFNGTAAHSNMLKCGQTASQLAEPLVMKTYGHLNEQSGTLRATCVTRCLNMPFHTGKNKLLQSNFLLTNGTFQTFL